MRRCHNKHRLVEGPSNPPDGVRFCDMCGRRVLAREVSMSCTPCDTDVCAKCVSMAGAIDTGMLLRLAKTQDPFGRMKNCLIAYRSNPRCVEMRSRDPAEYNVYSIVHQYNHTPKYRRLLTEFLESANEELDDMRERVQSAFEECERQPESASARADLARFQDRLARAWQEAEKWKNDLDEFDRTDPDAVTDWHPS